MGKFKMPTVKTLLSKKVIYGPKKDPVWVYLEKEMIENIAKKPYNHKVGDWLKFLKDLRYFFYCEGKRKERRLLREVGPVWYVELSSRQREVLTYLKANIHQDLLEDLPNRIRQSLSDLGVTLRLSKPVLMGAMVDSVEDPGVFIWNLYTAVYKTSPSELRKRYDMNAMILLSTIVFIDLDECIERLEKLTEMPKPPPPIVKQNIKKYYEPNCRYGEYLQQMYVPLVCNHSSGKKKPFKPLPLGCKLRLRTEESYTRLRMDLNFLEQRKARNKKEKESERICTYKFWEPPSTLRNTNPKLAAFVNQLKMIKKKAKPKFKAPYKNVQYQVGGVSFCGGSPHYVLANVGLMPTGYISINGGIVNVLGEFVTTIIGFWKYPREVKKICDKTCNCLEKWEESVMDYLKDSKCRCGHLYDFHHGGKIKEKFFHPPTSHGPFWVDRAKIYQMDPMEDFIINAAIDAEKSVEPTPEPSMPTISPGGLKGKELLAALLADLSDTPLLIPHLPQANLLNNLQEWARKRMKGKITPSEHKRFILTSLRRWIDLKHIDFRARAYRIPWTLKQLHNLNWSHRYMVQELFNTLLENFVSRNRLKQLEQTRMWWSTTKYDTYPSKPFLDIFFTYMPGRTKDSFLVNPYSSELTPKHGAKTCPL